MLKKIFIVFSLMLIASTASGLESQHIYGSWTAGALHSKDAGTVYRAISSVERKTSLYVYFAIDLSPDCKTYNPNLIMVYHNGVDADGPLNIGPLKIRIDRMKVVSGAWESSANEMGDKYVFISLYTKKQNELLRDIELGNTARIKLGFRDKTKDDIFFNFGLNGSAAAIKWAAQLCRSRVGGSDSDYFDKGAL